MALDYVVIVAYLLGMIGGDPQRREHLLDEWKVMATAMLTGPALARASQQ
ncbi:hypothetical protein ACFQ1S_05060 [Kibdelosporangium lantanae]|uniref:TetR family transcriptional regulator n=1 Tax=Kibdelosporangium lantanae TaxID=1497396 RepID=A0ABW3M502_9PSEU